MEPNSRAPTVEMNGKEKEMVISRSDDDNNKFLYIVPK